MSMKGWRDSSVDKRLPTSQRTRVGLLRAHMNVAANYKPSIREAATEIPEKAG